jgi:hypothetical protein
MDMVNGLDLQEVAFLGNGTRIGLYFGHADSFGSFDVILR